MGVLASNPRNVVDKPRPIEPELSIWTVAEVKRFLRFAKGDALYPFFLVLFTTGIRMGEVLGIRWPDINFIDRTISVVQQIMAVKDGYHICPPKTRATGRRTIDVSDEILQALLAQKAHVQKLKQM